MCDHDASSPPLEIQDIAALFLEFRGHGISLSAMDVDILKSWEQRGLEPSFLARVMLEMYEEYSQAGKPFPRHLSAVAKRVHSVLLKMREY